MSFCYTPDRSSAVARVFAVHPARTIEKMNRRDFVSRAVTTLVAGSQVPGHKLLAAPADADERWILTGEHIRASLGVDGTIRSMEVKNAGAWEDVEFCRGAFAGPAWADVTMQRSSGSAVEFVGSADGIHYSLRYKVEGDRLAVVARLRNERRSDYTPKAARLVLGINCEMLSYPKWNYRYFPTLLRCEKTHFWGYFMTPYGRILTVGSPDPIASYIMNYEKSSWGDGGHLINTCSLDLMHTLPLPPRHPQDLTSLKAGEERTWTIYLQPAGSLEEIKPLLAASVSAPMIDMDRYTLAEGESSNLTLWAKEPVTVTVTAEDASSTPLAVHSAGQGKFSTTFIPNGGPGLYKIVVAQADGRSSEACVSVRRPWSWYLRRAREASLIDKQYASSHLEQWLGLETGVLARRYVPDASLDAQTDKRLKEILDLQWDLTARRPTNMPKIRLLVNTAQMAGVLAYRYLSDEDPHWLDLASGFADYVVSRQYPDGNYDNYTTVAYPVKAVMTVMAVEQSVSTKDERLAAAYNRHYDSAKKAMDFLVRSKDDLTTEGQNTFEDGMISCAGMQLGLFALLQKDPEQRRHYAEAARKMMLAHRCLEQLLIPDSRMNGATLRFWEAQYDVLMGGSLNMMNSPHGWSAWLIPGLWYQYLLTGEEEWLQKTMNAMGSCVQLIDSATGQLRWGFVPDPYREVTTLVADPAYPRRGKRVDAIIGEQYVPMIASFHYPEHEPVFGNGWDSGWCCCNDVHEIFTSLAEVALTSAYVLERANGDLVAWNCKATRDGGGVISIQPAEEIVSRVHLNLRRPHQVNAAFAHAAAVSTRAEGLQWIGPGGTPELFSVA
jgi:hypothetical protein